MTLRHANVIPLLAPVTFGAEVTGLQRLTVTRDAGGASLTLDVAIEVDAAELRVAGFLLGQRVLLLTWDGKKLRESREAVVPAALSARTVLSELQFVYWPAEAIRAGLPRGWRLQENVGQRQLYRRTTLVFESGRQDTNPLGDGWLRNHLEHYLITIELADEP
ncbi:MAG: DUF3261 domain-containing protein [Pseudomonadota bacterium]